MKQNGRLSAQGLDENVVDAFRVFVKSRYGKLHTVFGQELQKAMELYLQNVTSTHTHQQQPEQKSVDEKMRAAEETIQTQGLLLAIRNGGSVRPNAIKKVLGDFVGIDPRTKNSYFNAFCQKHELVVNTDGELTEILGSAQESRT